MSIIAILHLPPGVTEVAKREIAASVRQQINDWTDHEVGQVTMPDSNTLHFKEAENG